MPRANSRLAIVTGAGSGLGRAFCRQLAVEKTWHIIAADIDEVGVRATLAEIDQLGVSSGEFAPLDVADAVAWLALRERLTSQRPRLDLLVNNAGVCLSAKIGEGSFDACRRVTEVNYLGVLYGCHAMTPWLRQSARTSMAPEAAGQSGTSSVHSPAVINVASVAAFLPIPSMAAYSASKAAVLALSETMYAELHPEGVNVTVVLPGFFRTQLLANGQFCTRRHRALAEKLARASTFTADDVAKAALVASRRGRLHIAVGRRARMLWRWKRMAPASLMYALARRYRRMFGREIEEKTRNN
jgi:NAD(P)-dependent dehydrogenase (short-subunit alcohol dehydrogenase family)